MKLGAFKIHPSFGSSQGPVIRLLFFVWLILIHPSSLTHADVIIQWNALHLDAIRNENISPPLAARNLAIVHASIYDAVNAVEGSHEFYSVVPVVPANALMEGAAVGAAHRCLINLYPSQRSIFDSALFAFLSVSPSGQFTGVTVGESVADAMLAWRSWDGASMTVPYFPSFEPGAWLRTPPFFRPPELPQWGYVTAFAMTNSNEFLPDGPPALDSVRYAQDFNQVKELGSAFSTTRTDEQTLIARFWSDFSYTVTPPGHWNQIAQNVATNHGTTLPQNARLFALINLAMADVGIAAWDAKYAYNFWRPVTAIQRADEDGNASTVGDPGWLPLLNTPPFPEYVSGHSAFSAAAATLLARFFGTDRIAFTVGSDTLPEVIRSYASFSQAADEVGMSRIFGGIHFLSADLDGLKLGRALGDFVFQTYLLVRPLARFLSFTKRANGGFHATVSATSDQLYVIQTSTNLTSWDNMTTNRATNGLLLFTDPKADYRPACFYRAVLVP